MIREVTGRGVEFSMSVTARYSKDVLSLQLKFAEKIAQVSGQPFEYVLFEHTMLAANILRIDADTDPAWQEYLHGLSQCHNRDEWTYEFYLQMERMATSSDSRVMYFGCFYYYYPWRDTRDIQLHFRNRETSGEAPLSRLRAPIRRGELKQMFQHVRTHHPDAERVRGGSWLYNIEAYRRLFPPAYISTARPADYETSRWASLWNRSLDRNSLFQWPTYTAMCGQFLDRNRDTRKVPVQEFLSCLEQQATIEGCLSCFPYQVLIPRCPIDVFYNFYGIE